MRAALLLLLWGCAENSDPCEGKPAACVAVSVLGSQTLDELSVTATLPGGTQVHGRVADLTPPTFVPPVQFALLLPEDTAGTVEVALVGSLAHEPMAAGKAYALVPAGGHGSVTVRLAAFAGDLSLAPLPLDFGSDLGASVDALPTVPTLTPGVYSFPPTLVGRSSPLALTFVNPLTQDVVISAVEMLPAGPPFTVAGSGTCAPAKAIAPGQSCTLAVNFAPLQRGQVTAEVRVSFGADGETSSLLDGRGVAWLAEGLAEDAGAVPTFFTMWGTSLDDAWTGGDHSTLFHRTQNGWTKVAPPAAATTVSAIWGTGVNDLWIASFKELSHTLNGTLWTPITLVSSGNVVTLWGQNNLYAASSAGEIWHYSGSNWNSEQPADNSSLNGLWGSDDNDVYAVGQGNKILHRSGTWAALPATQPAGDHYAVWGASPDDVWISGCDLTGSNCGFIKHLSGGVAIQVTSPKTGALYGLWGSSQNDIFAVGKGGAILHYDGSIWSSEASSTSADLRAVWGSGGEVFAVGSGGTILHRY